MVAREIELDRMSTCLVALGSNKSFCGQAPAAILGLAAATLFQLGTEGRLSPFYRSPAWPDPSAPAYVNAVALFETCLSAEELLVSLHAIEAGFGRVRSPDPAERYAPRSLDLDLIDHGGQVRGGGDASGGGLILPHPRAGERAFVLAPLLDLVPDWRHPITDAAGAALLSRAGGRVDRLPFIGAA